MAVTMDILSSEDGVKKYIDFSDEDEFVVLTGQDSVEFLDMLRRGTRILNPYPVTTGYLLNYDDNSFYCGFSLGRIDYDEGYLLTVTYRGRDPERISLKVIMISNDQMRHYIHRMTH